MTHTLPWPEVSLARDRAMLAALLGEDRVGRVVRPHRDSMTSSSDRWPASVTTSRALLVSMRSSRRSGPSGPPAAPRGRWRTRARRLAPDPSTTPDDRVAVTASGTRPEGRPDVVPNSVTSELNVRVSCEPSRGVVTKAAVPVPASPTRDRRHMFADAVALVGHVTARRVRWPPARRRRLWREGLPLATRSARPPG